MIVGYKDYGDPKDVLKRFRNGTSAASLAREFNTSNQTMASYILKLVNRERLLKHNELYRSMYESEVEIEAATAKRIINAFRRKDICTIHEVKQLSREEILSMRNLGPKVIKIMENLGWLEKESDTEKETIKPVSIITGKPCSWKQRCTELESILYRRYVFKSSIEDIDNVLYEKINYYDQ